MRHSTNTLLKHIHRLTTMLSHSLCAAKTTPYSKREREWIIDTRDRKPIAKTGETVSAIGIGTWGIRSYEKALEALIHAVELGIDMIDTAEMYGWGRAEELVGRLARTVGRDKVFITTKMLPSHLTSRDEVLRAAKASLRRLGVDTVDLYLIHWPNPSLTIEEQVRNFEYVYLEGMARYIGVSNFDAEQLERARTAARKAEIVADQVYYNVYVARDVETSLLPYTIQNNILIQAYTPLEKGRVAQHPVIKKIARETGKTPIQVALNYLISRPLVTAIPKSENKKHVEEIAGALGWRLSRKHIEQIEKTIHGQNPS